MRIAFFLIITIVITLATSCASKRFKDVAYISQQAATANTAPKLNVFIPRHSKTAKLPVLIFIHGGNWDSGSKDTYGFFGRNFARKGAITIIPDYTLSPDASYDAMATQVAAAIHWAKKHVAEYGGDPDKLFITGHSAGGHLAALAVMNPRYKVDPNAISGIILNDAAGLDIKHYLEENPPSGDYIATWGTYPKLWQDASPIYFLDKDTPHFLIYSGNKTYESIKETNTRFLAALHPYQPEVVLIRINKKHIPMITQYFWPWSKRFDEIIAFMKKN